MQPSTAYHIYTHANGFENLFHSDENNRYFLERYEHFAPSVADTYAYCLMPNHIHFIVRIKTEKELLDFYSVKHPNKTLQGLKTLQGFRTLEELDEKEGFKILEDFVIRQFGHLLNAYTQAFNKMYKRKGSLFIHSFKRKEITSNDYLTNIIRYVHTNPVHHGFVKEITDWPWSSYHSLLSDAPTFLKREEVIKWFGNREEFIKFHQQPSTLQGFNLEEL